MHPVEPGAPPTKRIQLSLKDATYDPNAQTGLGQQFQYTLANPNKIDYPEGVILVTQVPPPLNSKIVAEGTAECALTGWAKRAILSAPGFPSPLNKPARACCTVRKANDKGLGVFATEDVVLGTLVIAERPLAVTPAWVRTPVAATLTEEQYIRASYVGLEKQLELICLRMTPENLQKYKALANIHESDGSGPLFGVHRTNGFNLGLSDLEAAKTAGPEHNLYSCVGADASRLNHSCSPNVMYHFNLHAFCIEIYAMRPIARGEEMTVSYGDLALNAAGRRAYLQRAYKFTCTCVACKDPRASDEARHLALNALLPKTSQGVANAEHVLARYEATGLQSKQRYLALLERVASIQRKAGNKARADALGVLCLRLGAAFKGREHQGSEMAAQLLSGLDSTKENKNPNQQSVGDECATTASEGGKQTPSRRFGLPVA